MRCPACGASRLPSLILGLARSTRVRHSVAMDQADVNLVLNGGTHYSAAGKWSPGRL